MRRFVFDESSFDLSVRDYGWIHVIRFDTHQELVSVQGLEPFAKISLCD